MLLVVHAALVAVPLWKKVSAVGLELQERFAAGGAEESTNAVVIELESSEEATHGTNSDGIMWAREAAGLDIHVNPLSSKEDQQDRPETVLTQLQHSVHQQW